MIRIVEADADPNAAVILGLPIVTAVTRPALLADADPGSDEVQLTKELTSFMLPSLNVPVAVNC
jgi:hypothetical protein